MSGCHSDAKRPAMYTDWRSLWHSEAKKLGWHVAHCAAAGKPIHDRETWRLISRVRRLRERGLVESHVMDDTCCNEILRFIKDQPE